MLRPKRTILIGLGLIYGLRIVFDFLPFLISEGFHPFIILFSLTSLVITVLTILAIIFLVANFFLDGTHNVFDKWYTLFCVIFSVTMGIGLFLELILQGVS